MRVGILGGGQLSRMLALSSIHLGVDFSHFITTPENSVEGLGTLFFGDYDDLVSLDAFIDEVDVITFENENIPFHVLDYIQEKITIHPTISALQNTQDRLLEKQLFNQLNIPTNQYAAVDTIDTIKLFAEQYGYPVILKKRQFGYDGRGQIKINNLKQLQALTPSQIDNCIVEQFIPFDREVSIIGCRSTNQCVFYDINENQHEQGILKKTSNIINDPMAKSAQQYLATLMQHFNYYGTCTLEFFEANQQLIANEVAPRVHNSGHWTIEGAVTSQFENHIRAILNLPLGKTDSIISCEMYNIISTMPDLNKLLALQPLAVHDYKKQARASRKLGHINFDRNNEKRLEFNFSF